jgi:adenine-specific DNA-methyltransferase
MAQKETKHYGKLTVLLSKMAPELGMGDNLLKKTGAGNLFMIVGEPDIEIRRTSEGKVDVEVKGMDVYDPTTGQVRNSSPDEIACWFIDTDHNEESFFVRYVYVTGADKPYERLSKTLKADIDESAWQSLFGTISRPFRTFWRSFNTF